MTAHTRKHKRIRHEQTEKDILNLVRDNPGIGSKTLAVMISVAVGTSKSTIDHLITEMTNAGLLARTLVRTREKITEIGHYQCWLTLPAGKTSADLQPIKRTGKKDKPPLQLVLSPAQRNAALDPPKPFRETLQDIIKEHNPDKSFARTRISAQPQSYTWTLDALELLPVTNGNVGKVQADLVLHMKRDNRNCTYSTRVDIGQTATTLVSDLLKLAQTIILDLDATV